MRSSPCTWEHICCTFMKRPYSAHNLWGCVLTCVSMCAVRAHVMGSTSEQVLTHVARRAQASPATRQGTWSR